MALLDDLRQRRAAAREAADADPHPGRGGARDLAADELAAVPRARRREREADDAIEQEHERQLAEVRAASPRRPGPDPEPRRAWTPPARSGRRSSPRTRPRSRSTATCPTSGPTTCPSPSRAASAGSRSTPATPSRRTATQAHGHRRLQPHRPAPRRDVQPSWRPAPPCVTTATGEDLVVPKSTGFVTSRDHRRGRQHHRERPDPGHGHARRRSSTPTTSRSARSWPTTPRPTCSTSWPARPRCRWGWAPPATATT